jgi:hypothetical protein
MSRPSNSIFPDVAQRERLLPPVDERDRAGQVEAVQAPRLGRTGVDEPRLDALARRRRDAAHRRRLDAVPDGLERRPQEAPAVDGDLLDRDVAQPAVAQRAGGVLRHLAVLGRPGGAKAERARSDAREAFDGRAQPLRVDRQGTREGERVVRIRRRAQRAGPYIPGEEVLSAAVTCSSVRSRPRALAR